jgi:hypothetical protein
MPTVDIPEKICPHCDGTKWIIYKIVKKLATTGEIKTYNGFKCAKKNIQSGDKWRKNNAEHCKKVARERVKAKRKSCTVFADKDREHKKKYYHNHKEERTIYRKKWASLNPEKDRGYFAKNAKKNMENLSDYYVSRTIIGRNNILKKPDIPSDLIEIKRKQLTLIRKIKN